MRKKNAEGKKATTFSLKVGIAERYEDMDARETRLRVPFQIIDGSTKKGVVAVERIESFPLATTAKDIRQTLKRHLDVFTAEYARHEANKEQEAAVQHLQAVVEDISNLVIE
jgi:hypothetical protein